MNRIRNKLFIAFLIFVFVILLGTIGYHYFSDLSWLESVYMTVITFSTVGFGEVEPLNDAGKIFTIFIIICNIIVYAYAISILSEFMINAPIVKNIIRKRMEKTILKFHNHVILVGFGRNGTQALEKLKTYNKDVIIIEKDTDEIEFENNDKHILIEGDATQDDTLLNAGILNASAIITTLSTDADNLYVILSAKQLNPNIRIISRASNENAAKKLKFAGAHNVILPHKIGGEYMASLLVTPGLIEFLQLLSVEERNRRTNLEEISFDDCPEEYHNKSIASLDLRKLTGCTIVGYKNPDGEYLINPDPETKIVKGSTVIILGQPYQIKKLNELFDIE
ncbi:MAG: potassium channel protein [Saprospiraceae bacterium]